MTSTPVLEADLALLTAAEKVLDSVHGLPPAIEAIDKALEAVIAAEINVLKKEIPCCFMRGTMIATAAGEVAVEDLKVGDLVKTSSGNARPIIWVGHRGFDLDKHPHPRPLHVYPVLVHANAIGENLPVRDLWLSPGHNVFVDGVLVPVQALINGASIVRKTISQFEYWHVELAEHDIVFANGLTAESYLDTGNRASFVDGADYIERHADFSPKHWSDTCAPLIHQGEMLEKLRVFHAERAQNLGYAVTRDPDLHVVADGARLDPIDLGEDRYAFIVPAKCADVSLCSRTFVPAESDPDSADARELGVCIAELQINGKLIDLGTEEQFGKGWHKLERWNDEIHRRWTSGVASLSGDAKLVVVRLDSPGRYLVRDSMSAIRLVA